MKARRVLLSLLCLVLTFVLGGEVILSALSIEASATELGGIEETDPLEDLEGAVIDGVPFSVAAYNPDTVTEIKPITFFEYGYSRSSVDGLGFYIYVFTPRGASFSEVAGASQVSLKCGSEKNYQTYNLRIVNHSQDPILGGTYYKLAVELDAEQQSGVWCSLLPEERVYSLGELTIRDNLGVHSIPFSGVYHYTGYMLGCDPESLSEQTLSCKSDRGLTVELDVKSTFFRADMTNNTGDVTAIDSYDTLHSVYFSVPDSLVKEYGSMSAVTATWYDAVTAPSLVVGDETLYDVAFGLLDNKSGNLNYAFVSDLNLGSSVSGGTAYAGYSFNLNESPLLPIRRKDILFDFYANEWSINKRISPLRMVYPTATFDVDAADKYVVSAEDVKTMLAERTDHYKTNIHDFGEETFDLFYSPSGAEYWRGLFDSIAEEPTVAFIRSTDEFEIVEKVVDYSWWDRVFGTDPDVDLFKDKVTAIKAITDYDFTLEAMEDACAEGRVDATLLEAARVRIALEPDLTSEILAPLVADSLFINRDDYADFKGYYDEKKANGETVYLFRYQVADYWCGEVSVLKFTEDGDSGRYDEISTNAYFFQETINLGFDIIDITLSKDGVDTVIPVVMAAQDFFSDATPPTFTESDAEDDIWDSLKTIFLLVGLVILFILLSFAMPFIRPILDVLGALFKGLFAILFFPFKALGSWITRKRK